MKKIIIITIILCLLCLLFNKDIQYNIVSLVFSNIAPTKKEELNKKPISDKLFDTKHELENVLKQEIKECNLQKILTIDYQSIKNKLDKKYFEELTHNYTKPILIRGVYTDDELKQYNYKDMKKVYGNIIVDALYQNGKDFDGQKMSLSKYLDLIDSGKKYYLTVNNSLATNLNKEMFMKFIEKLFGNSGFFNIFVGNRNSYTHLHSELAASCAIQLNGIKKWYLIDPKYSKYLDGIPDKENIFVMASRGFNHTVKTNEIEKIPRYEIICEKGDFLYVPPWYWHEAQNLTNESIMLSFRPSLFTIPYKTNLNYTLLGLKNSIGFNDVVYPLAVKMGIYDPNQDTVVNSIKEILNRTSDKYFIKKIIA